jgi:hypothetical protein
MSEVEAVSCASVSSSVAGEPSPETAAPAESSGKQVVSVMSVRVGHKAP